jgi:hypothetical protein
MSTPAVGRRGDVAPAGGDLTSALVDRVSGAVVAGGAVDELAHDVHVTGVPTVVGRLREGLDSRY